MGRLSVYPSCGRRVPCSRHTAIFLQPTYAKPWELQCAGLAQEDYQSYSRYGSGDLVDLMQDHMLQIQSEGDSPLAYF